MIELLTIVVPVRNEAQNIGPLFEQLARDVMTRSEVLIVYDTDTDPTVAAARSKASSAPFDVRLIRNSFGSGPANALRAGFDAARGDAVVVVMADLSDQLTVIDRMILRMNDGADLVAGSRYVRGGRQDGGPFLKGILSRTAGVSLRVASGLPTYDATNAFKMYRTSHLRALRIDSSHGFEISMEITVKGWLAGWRIDELPAIWTDRVAGSSKFQLWRWLPRYLHWYFYALKNSLLKRIFRRRMLGKKAG